MIIIILVISVMLNIYLSYRIWNHTRIIKIKSGQITMTGSADAEWGSEK